MIGLLLKNWRFIIDVLLVIGLVVLLFWWNPMKIFGGGLKLEETANLVTEVNQIQELVTAEYYGEVITSIEEARLNPLAEDKIRNDVRLLYDDLLAALQHLKDYQDIPKSQRVDEYREGEKTSNWRRKVKHEVDSRNILDKLEYLELMVETQSDPYFRPLMGFLWRTIYNQEKGELPNDRDEEATLYAIYRNPPIRSMATRELDEFMEDYYFHLQESISRRESRKKLTMIGRGWVKAGFDFSDLGPESVVYYEESGIVHLIGIAPKILNADINPWFIPEKGIPGFQILDERGPVNFHDAKRVKQYCIDKLTVQAYQASILKNAHDQGQETLKNFFSLLTDKEINQVIFHSSPFTTFAREAAKDEWISYAEAYMLDSLLELEIGTIDSLNRTVQNQSVNKGFANEHRQIVQHALHDLGQYPYQDGRHNFGFLSKLSSDIAQDSLIDKQEEQLIQTLRYQVAFDHQEMKFIQRDSTERLGYWIEHPLQYLKMYNTMLRDWEGNGVIPDKFDTVTVSAKDFDPEMYLDTVKIIDYFNIDQESIELVYSYKAHSETFYYSLYYPLEFELSALEGFITSKDVPYDSVAYSSYSRLSVVEEGFWIVDQRLNEQYAFHIKVSPDQLFPKHLTDRLLGQQFLYRSDTAYLGFGGTMGAETDSAAITRDPLSIEQVNTVSDFFAALLDARKKEQNKGFVQKTTDWLRSRTSSTAPKTLFVGRKGFRFQE
ncbi:DUF4230 domain-containing protein [Echinicola rosea]|uniref:DUF3114 domain-containing protein n=1 Tax=Echinicola rosea TaxID=1807691 RepID=A0ABQ1UYQ3_9BACT|nr:DUF4230 domain-containing protein [Echinicola rosea]GGF30668.1 hypothetical protein GCM10011339_18590 [Echinicola rosea]